MNRSLTHCRKVGLSRKKNTPSKTVEDLLNRKENIVAETSSISEIHSNKTVTPKPTAKSEINNDTPCRQVGLSRKRKTSTPSSYFEITKNVTPTPSNSRASKRKSCKVENNSLTKYLERPSPNSSDNTFIVENNDAISKGSRSYEDNHISCAKKLSNLFSSPSNDKMEQDGANTLQDPQFSGEHKNSESDQEVSHTIKSAADNNTVENRISIECSPNSIDDMGAGQKKIVLQNNNEKLNQTIHCDENENSNIGLSADISSGMVARIEEDSNNILKKDSQFIKVSYSDKKENMQGNVLKPKKSEFSRELFDGDDDFEIGPKQKKPKKIFERSKTELIKKNKKSSTNKLKKSLSVGHSRSRTLTDSSITSNTSSLNLFSDCFVKLEQKESIHQKNLCLTPQHQSDDDFESFTCTPKENKIKNLDSLEKEVEEKRQILGELKRAKMYKNMHNIEDLKKLTARWKTGCSDALHDLFKQLNTHSQMTMGMLLRKLNIPEDFV